MSKPDYDAREVLGNYMAILNTPGNCLIRDVSELAHPKEIIKFVLQHCIRTAGEGEMREFAREAYVALANFQELADAEKEAVAVLGNVGEPGPPGSELHKEQASRIANVAVPLQAVMSRLKAEAAVLTQELKSLPGAA